MEISWCNSIEEIVSSTEEGDESDENEIIFQQLNCLKLEGLRKLRRFYKGSLSFPSLEEFTVWRCERMESLCAGTVKTDKLLQVTFKLFLDDIPLETDLNSAMQNR
nr:unknown [Glycine max]